MNDVTWGGRESGIGNRAVSEGDAPFNAPESRTPHPDLRGKRVLVMGLGNRQGGLGVARYLVEAGADVRVTDLRDDAALAATLADLAGLPIGYTLGRHEEEDFRWAEVVVRNPAVPRESRWLALARRCS